MKSIYCAVCITVLAGVSACKKETVIRQEYNPAIPVYGLWRIAESPEMPDLQYLYFKQGKVCDIYTEDDLGFKGLESANFQPSPDQVIIDFSLSGSSVIYNYITRGDSVILTKNGTVYLKGVKAQESDVAGWLTEVSFTEQITGLYTSEYGGIGYDADADNILLASYSNSQVLSINLTSKNLGTAVNLQGGIYPNTVEYCRYSSGPFMLLSNSGDNHVLAYDFQGAAVAPVALTGTWVSGIAVDAASVNNSSLYINGWGYSGGADSLYHFSSSGSTEAQPIGDGFNDLAWHNDRLYICRGNYIYRLKSSPVTVEKAYRLNKNSAIWGIAATGSDNFWLNIEGDKLVRVVLK